LVIPKPRMAAAAANPEQPCKKARRVGRGFMHAIVREPGQVVNLPHADAG